MLASTKRSLIISLLTLSLFSGCTSVQYNGAKTEMQKVSYPPIDKTVTAYVGDHMVEKGVISQIEVLRVLQPIDGAMYNIPAKTYAQLGFDSSQDFYEASGVTKNLLADPFNALSVNHNQNDQICVVTVFGVESCYAGQFERQEAISETSNSFQQTLIYSGRVGDKINIGYREFSSNLARPAFNNEVEYDLSESSTIGYKGALVEVIEANNNSIKYRLLRNFPDTNE
ncbi:hypothetical protein [Marinobacter halotolerans]|uniref:hypothetical protein n=1 Tax=Marinobacter halotolerans TaxID=1569211 RepID=UPI001246E428|nr:hypothetical protein [Marinobacter halotolerans]